MLFSSILKHGPTVKGKPGKGCFTWESLNGWNNATTQGKGGNEEKGSALTIRIIRRVNIYIKIDGDREKSDVKPKIDK